MIRRLISNSKTIAGGAFVIAATSLASRLLGVLRDRILAAEVGPGTLLDSYFAAFRIPDTVFNLIVLGAISAGFIPVFLDCIHKEGKEKSWELVSNVMSTLFVLLIFVSIVLFIFAGKLTRLIAPGFDVQTLHITTTMTRIMLVSPILFGISSVFGGVLQSLRQFFIYSLAPIFYNIGIIVGALFLIPVWGIYGLAVGVIVGAFFHMAIQYPAVRQAGFRYQWRWNIRDAYTRKIARLMVPRTLSLAVTQINLFAVTFFGSMISEGSISIFNLANNLQSFPLGIFAISLAVAAFPTLTSLAVRGEREEFLQNFSSTTRQILFFLLPATALLIVLRAQIVRVIYGSGMFDWNDTRNTADALAFFALSLFAQGLVPLLARSFYAYHDTKTPFYVGIFSVGLNIALSFALVSAPWVRQYFSPVIGLVMAFSISQMVQCLLMWILLRLKLRSLHEFSIIVSVFKTSMATFSLGLSAHLMKYLVEPFTGTSTFVGIFLQGALSAAVGIGFFVLICFILRSEEMFSLIFAVKRRIYRNTEPVQESIEEADM